MNYQDSLKNTALTISVTMSNFTLSQLYRHYFHLNCNLDQLEAVKLLIENGADVNAKNIDEDSAIHFAASSGKF